jgi:ketosteroid isomerase-like protein
MSRENVETARHWMALNNERDVAGVVRLMSPEIECFPADDQPEAKSFRGPDAFAGYVESWLDVFDHYEIEASEYIDNGDCVIVVGHIEARSQATGIEVADDAAWLLRFRDGKAIEYRECKTRADALEAAGLSE